MIRKLALSTMSTLLKARFSLAQYSCSSSESFDVRLSTNSSVAHSLALEKNSLVEDV
jgi:hypothetical protein